MAAEYDLHFEWGLAGLQTLARPGVAVAIVDVLSFSTAVDIAVARGATVLPYRWQAEGAAQFAASRGALLAGRRSHAGAYSLSPASLLAIQPGTALVLPSPNGSTLSLSAGHGTVAACLRNAGVAAAALRKRGQPVAAIAAGEQWPDASLRPCLEDLLGAGALLAGLLGRLSPEAESAVAAFERFRHRLPETLADCLSGRELIARGFAADVELAAQFASSRTVPVLREDRYVALGPAAC